MGRFTAFLRNFFHSLQFGGAVAACALYASNYDGLNKDYRWNFAITTSAFSIAGTIIQAVFSGCFPEEFDSSWIILSGICSGILFLFWTGVLGTFATSFIHLDPNDNNGVRMMRIAVYIDAANMVIWFLTVAYMIVKLVKYESRDIPPRRNAEELHQLGRPSSTEFVPYGWDTVDIEAQTPRGSVQIESPLPPPVDMYPTHRNISDPALPVPHPPINTTANDRNISRFQGMVGARSVSEVLPLLPEEPQHYPPMPPPIRSPDTLHSPIRESRPYPAPPPLPLKPKAYRHSSYRPVGHPSYEQVADAHDRLNAYNTSLHPASPEFPQRIYSWPMPFKLDEPTKECPICAEEYPCWTGFPSRIARACSSHEQEACRDCIARTIAAEIDTNISGQIHCFECRAVLEYQEVKALATPTTFERYEAMGLRSFVSNDPNFVWCQSRHCEAGQEHVGGVDQPIVTCQACGFKTCFKHQIPWHEEMLCDEYDERLPLSDDERRLRAQQELASIAAVHEVTKPCANKKCKAPIQKNMGCDHMTCRACKHEFCWVCGANWGGRHRSGCGHR